MQVYLVLSQTTLGHGTFRKHTSEEIHNVLTSNERKVFNIYTCICRLLIMFKSNYNNDNSFKILNMQISIEYLLHTTAIHVLEKMFANLHIYAIFHAHICRCMCMDVPCIKSLASIISSEGLYIYFTNYISYYWNICKHRQAFTMWNYMVSSGLWKILYLPILY